MIIFPLKNDLTIELESAIDYTKALPKQWENMMQDNYNAITEINALESDMQEPIKKIMQDIIANNLPDSDPVTIVDGILSLSVEPYDEYIQLKSKEWTFDVAEEINQKNSEIYQTEMEDYLSEETFYTNFATYYFKINDFNLETDNTTATTYTHKHEADWYGINEPFANPEPYILEEDVVNMADFKEDITPDYLKLLQDKNKQDGEELYKNIAEEFMNDHHALAIDDLNDFFNNK